MRPRLAILFSAGALALLPTLPAQAAEKASISYPSEASVKSPAGRAAVVQGQRNVLEMVAEQLDLSAVQKGEVEDLLHAEQEQVTALHQDLKSSDAQKSALFRQIRQQTKDRFIAVLTQDQRREFSRIMGR